MNCNKRAGLCGIATLTHDPLALDNIRREKERIKAEKEKKAHELSKKDR